MKRRTFLKNTVLTIGSFAAGKVVGEIASSDIHKGNRIVLLNPYKKVVAYKLTFNGIFLFLSFQNFHNTIQHPEVIINHQYLFFI